MAVRPVRGRTTEVARPAAPGHWLAVAVLCQRQLPVYDTGKRIVVVWFRSSKPECLVEVHGFREPVEGVEAHHGVPEFSCDQNDLSGEFSSCALAPGTRSHEKALHLAHPIVQLANRHTSNDPLAIKSDEEVTVWARVRTGQPGKLLLEPLKAQVDTQESLVLPKKGPYFFNLRFRFRLLYSHLSPAPGPAQAPCRARAISLFGAVPFRTCGLGEMMCPSLGPVSRGEVSSRFLWAAVTRSTDFNSRMTLPSTMVSARKTLVRPDFVHALVHRVTLCSPEGYCRRAVDARSIGLAAPPSSGSTPDNAWSRRPSLETMCVPPPFLLVCEGRPTGSTRKAGARAGQGERRTW